jgi:hypothetical protein
MRQTKTYIPRRSKSWLASWRSTSLGCTTGRKVPTKARNARWPNLPATIIAASAISALAIYLSFGIR